MSKCDFGLSSEFWAISGLVDGVISHDFENLRQSGSRAP